MKKIFYIIAAYSLFIISCGHSHSHGDHDHEGHNHSHGEQTHENTEKPGTITFSQAQANQIDFAVETPILGPLGQIIKTTARIVSDQTDETIVAARTSGIVIFTGNTAVEGKNVSPGQELFSISGSGIAENSINVRLAEAQSLYLKAETDYLRAQNLAKDKIVSDKELLNIRTEYETAKAVYDNLNKNFSNNGQSVSSPVAGFVKQVFVSNGQYIESGQPLVSISKNKSLLLKADVPARYASFLPYIVSANIRKPNEIKTYTLEELNGKVLSFGRTISENNYLIPVSFQIDNKAWFIPGGIVELFIKTKSEIPVLSVPKEALIENQSIFFVLVQVTPDSYEKREVKTGVTDGIRTEIISGLHPEEKVVTKGTISVKLAESAGTLDPHAGHIH